MGIKKHIPNTITSLNLLAGCISIAFAFEGYLLFAVYMVFIAAILDFLDGMTARLLNEYSIVGKELDSLADVISFGAAPSVIVYHMMKISLFQSIYLPPVEKLSFAELILLIIPFMIAILSGVRLAKFNVDNRQNEIFIGLPVPANALFFVSFYLVSQLSANTTILDLLKNEYALAGVSLIFPLILVAEFPMFSLKFKNYGFKGNKIRYIFIVLSAILLILLHAIAIPLIIVLYILLSATNNWIVNLD